MPALWLWATIAAMLSAAGGGVYYMWPKDAPPPEAPAPPPAASGDFDLTMPPKATDAPKPTPSPPPVPPAPALLVVSPASVDFTIVIEDDGTLRDGQAARAVRLTNTGGQPLAIEELLTAGGLGTFGADAACTGRQLPPTATCDVTVTFRPMQPGAFEATLVVDHSAGENTRIRLTGLAQRAATPAPSGEAERLKRLRAERAAGVAAATASVGRLDGNVLRRALPQSGATTGNPAPPRQAGYGEGVVTVPASLPVDRARILTRDQVIPAVMKSSVSSRIPGSVLATVERDVWSSGADAHRLILIPKGTSLIGRQASSPQRGDARLAVVWTEMIRPDGARILVSGESADAMGRAGLVGKVDDRLVERYGAAVLISLLGTAEDVLILQLDEQDRASSNDSTVVVAGESSTSNFGSIARNLVDETLDLPPVITVAQGTRFHVLLTADVRFPGPPFDTSMPGAATGTGTTGNSPSAAPTPAVQPAPGPVPVGPTPVRPPTGTQVQRR